MLTLGSEEWRGAARRREEHPRRREQRWKGTEAFRSAQLVTITNKSGLLGGKVEKRWEKRSETTNKGQITRRLIDQTVTFALKAVGSHRRVASRGATGSGLCFGNTTLAPELRTDSLEGRDYREESGDGIPCGPRGGPWDRKWRTRVSVLATGPLTSCLPHGSRPRLGLTVFQFLPLHIK